MLQIENQEASYRVYFFGGGQCMCSRWRISAHQVAVRVGPQNTFFYFEGADGGLFTAIPVSDFLSLRQVREQFPQAVLI